MLDGDRSTEDCWIGSVLRASEIMIRLEVAMITFLAASALKAAK